MGQSCRTHDGELLKKWQTHISSHLKAKEVEDHPFISARMKQPLIQFFALLFLSISSVFTEQSQICVKIFWSDTDSFIENLRSYGIIRVNGSTHWFV